METPSLEGLSTKAKEDPSPHEMRPFPAGHQPSIFWCQGYYYYYYSSYCYYYIITIITIIIIVIIIIL